MAEQDLEKLLGGYATGTLTEEERRALFEAALHDQALFNALADEEALKELLDDPQARRRLLEALGAHSSRPAPRAGPSWVAWLRRPVHLAYAGGLATLLIAVALVIALQRQTLMGPSEGDLVARSKLADEDQRAPSEHEDVSRLQQEAPSASSPRVTPPPKAAEKVGPRDASPGRAQRATEPPAGEVPRPAEPLAGKAASEPEAVGTAKMGRSLEAPLVRPAEPRIEARRGQAALVTSFSHVAQAGSARELYYGRHEPRSAPEAAPMREALEKSSTERFEGSRLEPAPPAFTNLGLRYSVRKRAEDGTFRETNPAGPFRTDDALRLTVEVNEPGYLYVFRQGPGGRWEWTSASAPAESRVEGAGTEVLRGKRYLIPAEGSPAFSPEPSGNTLILVYSRKPRQGLETAGFAVAGEAVGEERRSSDLASLLKGARIAASSRPLFVEHVEPGQPEGDEEPAVYVVSPQAGPDESLAVQITLPSTP